MGAAIRKEEFYRMSETGKYTTADIEAVPEGIRAELLDGEMYMMAPPVTVHQMMLSWLNSEIYAKIKERGGRCKTIPAPFGVYIKKDNKNYVEPDISVICDMDKLDKKGCQGAPDWVIEIISPSSKRMDYYLKLHVYEEVGVREYWVVDPEKKSVVVYDLENNESPSLYRFTDTVTARILGDAAIDFSELEEYCKA